MVHDLSYLSLEGREHERLGHLVAVQWGSHREGLSLQELKEKPESESSRRDGVTCTGKTAVSWCLVIYSQHLDWSMSLLSTVFNILNINPSKGLTH